MTSPPYLDARPDYAQISPGALEEVFRELARVVDGPLLLNLGRLWRDGRELRWHDDVLDRAEFAGWELLDTLLWLKPNANPIQGRFLTNAHEYVYILGDENTELDIDPVRTPYPAESIARMNRRWATSGGVKNTPRNGREGARTPHPLGARPSSYVEVCTGREKGNEHPAPMALELAKYLIRLAGGRSVLDPFVGSGTTCEAARHLDRRSVGIDINEEYLRMAARRLGQQSLFAV